jgi:hypothetical protein
VRGDHHDQDALEDAPQQEHGGEVGLRHQTAMRLLRKSGQSYGAAEAFVGST